MYICIYVKYYKWLKITKGNVSNVLSWVPHFSAFSEFFLKKSRYYFYNNNKNVKKMLNMGLSIYQIAY